MSEGPPGVPERGEQARRVARARPRYGRYGYILLFLILALLAVNTLLSKPNGARGIDPGQRVPPFAVPLAQGKLTGDADTAVRAGEGARVAACAERGAQILNICQLYERGPVVLALFVDAGSCPRVLDDLQALRPSFPGVQFAGVALRADRGHLRRLAAEKGLTFPLGLDRSGKLLVLYRMASCPQVTFIYPGGVVQSPALLERVSRPELRAHVAALVAAARARGWRAPGRAG